MTVGSLFAGIGGFDLGFQRVGCRALWQVEQDGKAQSVLSRRFPDAEIFDDVLDVGAHNLTPVDVLCGGFPCQDVSVAGKRKGLAGERTGLFWEVVRIARELSTRWMVLENVPGLFSANRGRDFHTVLSALADLGYVGAWRVLDSRYFGVAQRRRRVFLVLHLGRLAHGPGSVLFESESRGRDSASSGQAGSHVARGTTDGVGFALRSDPGGTGQAHNMTYIPVAGPLGGGNDGTGRRNEDDPNLVLGESQSEPGNHLITATLNSGGNTGGFRTEPGEHISVSSNGVRRLTPLECERLQGFPDGWTCLCGKGHLGSSFCECADSPRYRQLGNAVTVPVIEWIARRILEADQVSAC